MSQVKVKRRIPSPKDLAQLLRFRKVILSPRKRRLTRALTIYDLRDIAKRRTPQAPRARGRHRRRRRRRRR